MRLVVKVLDACKDYFNGFQELSNFKDNDNTTNVLAGLKILSYFTVVIPMGFAAVYGAASLYGRVSKTQDLTLEDKTTHQKGKEIILKRSNFLEKNEKASFDDQPLRTKIGNYELVLRCDNTKNQIDQKDYKQCSSLSNQEIDSVIEHIKAIAGFDHKTNLDIYPLHYKIDQKNNKIYFHGNPLLLDRVSTIVRDGEKIHVKEDFFSSLKYLFYKRGNYSVESSFSKSTYTLRELPDVLFVCVSNNIESKVGYINIKDVQLSIDKVNYRLHG